MRPLLISDPHGRQVLSAGPAGLPRRCGRDGQGLRTLPPPPGAGTGQASRPGQSHERMLRERLTACRTSEEHAQSKAEEAHEAMVATLESRGRLAARLVDIVDQDRSHRCTAQALAHEPLVIRWARRETE